MWDNQLIFLFVVNFVGFASCGYPPMGDEVQSGSVLLPASRRGRYLANIVRRQAVDGTVIKFNKDADRMNAESKKKADVLSEELLPYIIAEQERRTTLYKRVMTAIQNGEKGVTIVEIRNKPPAIIRKGVMYRCPTNRAPREPDGSGTIMCEDNITPTAIMFESCLSAEDRELYVTDNKYFFCNRHRIEGPDLPQNGTSVIGCAPAERTSLNYTSQNCALEDSDDVVVHYRYYPDRSYKFVSELDPDREVCEHWNPCQVGYIFSLAGPDKATPATELWHDYNCDDEDDKNETISLAQDYVTSTRRIRIPMGYEYHEVGKYLPNGLRSRVSRRDGASDNLDNIEVRSLVVGDYIEITMIFHQMRAEDATTYYVRFEEIVRRGHFVNTPLVTLNRGQTLFTQHVQLWLPPQQLNATRVDFSCASCELRGIMLRAADGSVRNLEVDKYHLRKLTRTSEHSVVELDTELITPRDIGDYFLMIQNDGGSEERIKALTLREIKLTRLNLMKPVGRTWFVWKLVPYDCGSCKAIDVLCRGESVLGKYRFVLKPEYKSILVQIMSFKDSDSCVYVGIFEVGDTSYRKMIAIIENISVEKGGRIRLAAPEVGTPFEYKIHYTCWKDCTLTQVNVNGLSLESSSVGSVAYYLTENSAVTIGVTMYSSLYQGMYQGVFSMSGRQITKNLMEIWYEEVLLSVPEPEPEDKPEPEKEPEPETELEDYDYISADGRRKHQPPGTRSGGKKKQPCMVHILRDSMPAGHAYKHKIVGYDCPGGQLVAVSCRGQNVTTGFGISTDNTVNIDFDHFEDTHACVYIGIFKIGQTEHRKTLAVFEIINVSVSAAVPPPPSGEFKHKVVYTCNIAKCDPAMIYINDKTLRSDDKNAFYSYKSEMVKGNDKEILTVTINFSIKPFTKEYEGVYQLVVTNGKERVTKNIMEIGALI